MPLILSEAPITLQAAGEANGAASDVWKAHAVRTADGTLYAALIFGDPAYAVPNPDQNSAMWYTHLWKLFVLPPGTTAWQDTSIAGRAGREPVALALTPADELVLLAWPHNSNADPYGLGAHPVIHRQSAGFLPESVPGDWSTVPVSNEHYPYAQLAADAAGRLFVVQCVAAGSGSTPNTPGILRVAIRDTDGTWSPIIPHTCDQRHTVPHLLPTADGYDLIATRDCLFTELGLSVPQDSNSFAYSINRIAWWHVGQRGQTPPPVVLGEETPTLTFPRPLLYGRDVYRDPTGTLHVVGEDNGPGVGYSGRHTQIAADARWQSDRWPVPYQNLSRIVQDAAGTFYALSLYQGVLRIATATDALGIGYGPVMHGQPPPAGQTDPTYDPNLTLHGSYPAGLNYNLYVARGAAPSNVVDLLFDIDNSRWYHVRLQLAAAQPVPVPPPTPTPPPAPDPLAALTARVTALETTLARVQAALGGQTA